MDRYDVVIVGAGHAGAQAAIALRQAGFDGRIALVGEEPDLPYERPPLSKDYLSGERPFERMLIREAAFWERSRLDLLLGRRVEAVEAHSGRLAHAGGHEVAFSRLVWAAGGRPRRLSCPGQDARGIHCVRSRADVDAIRADLGAVRSVAIVGGGYVGLEAAAVLTRMGKSVTVLELEARVLARVAGPALSAFFEREHRTRGVTLRTDAEVERFDVADGRVTAVHLATGERVPADLAVVGIGIEPAVEPLLAAGIRGSDGVEVDERCRTSVPHIYAVGDCALQRSAFAAVSPIRIESLQNANDMARAAAADIAGRPAPKRDVPWFWSDQFDLRLQSAGLGRGYDEEIVRGDPASRSFSVVYLSEGHVVAVDSVNAPRDHMQARLLVNSRARASAADLADPGIPLAGRSRASSGASVTT